MRFPGRGLTDSAPQIILGNFIFEATRVIGGRLMSTQPFQRMGISKEVAKDYLTRSKIGREFEDLMWMNVLPNLKKIGLLTGFLKEKYGEMGLLKYGDFDHAAMLEGFIYEGLGAHQPPASSAEG